MINISRLRRGAVWSIIATCMILVVCFITISIFIVLSNIGVSETKEEVTDVLLYCKDVQRAQIINSTYFINAMDLLENTLVEVRTMYVDKEIPRLLHLPTDELLEKSGDTKEQGWIEDFSGWVEGSKDGAGGSSLIDGY